jgi:hypothetical protein
MWSNKILFIALLFPEALLAQMPLDPESKLYTYQEVVEVEGVSKDDLYTRARTWFVKEYKSANAVLQMDDKEAGTLMGKGFFKVMFQGALRDVYHTVQIDVKDDRYRYSINAFKLKFSHVYNEKDFELLTNKDFWGISKLIEATHQETKSMINGLKNHMQKADKEW